MVSSSVYTFIERTKLTLVLSDSASLNNFQHRPMSILDGSLTWWCNVLAFIRLIVNTTDCLFKVCFNNLIKPSCFNYKELDTVVL